LIKEKKSERFFRWLESVLKESEKSWIEMHYCPRFNKEYFCFHTHPKREVRQLPLTELRPDARFYFSYPDLIFNVKSSFILEREKRAGALKRIGDCILYHDENDKPTLKCLPAWTEIPPIVEELREKWERFREAATKFIAGEISKEEYLAVYNDYVDFHRVVDKELKPCILHLKEVKSKEAK
jgi:hypothetical protein